MVNSPSQSQEPNPSFVEVGNFVLIARVFPERSAWYWMGRQRPGPVAAYQRRLTLPNVFDLRRTLSAKSTRLAFVHVPIRPRKPFDQSLVRMMHGDFGVLAFREVLSAPCPVVGLDFNDAMTISDIALKVLERSCCYFKRELPADIQQLLPRSASSAQRRILEKNAHKLMPASLGLSADRLHNLPKDEHEKKHDVFFSGDTSSEVRRRELHLMDELKARGVRVFRPESRLSQQEFFQCCSESYLVWSPEGAGWDCFRHYESAGCGSVPLMNVPCIKPYVPFVHGQHALYYLSDFGNKSARCPEFQGITDGLVSTVTRALEDRRTLREMGRAARGFVLRHHTHEAIVTHIVRTAEAQSPAGVSST